MNRVRTLVILMAPLFAASANSEPVVEVSFVQPERYADAAPGSATFPREREVVQAELRRHVEALSARYLVDGDRLAIEFLDIDLAGSREQIGGTLDVRVTRNRPMPALKIRYRLGRAGVESTGEETLRDLGFIRWDRCFEGATLCYEKRLLDRWFASRFGAAAAPPG